MPRKPFLFLLFLMILAAAFHPTLGKQTAVRADSVRVWGFADAYFAYRTTPSADSNRLAPFLYSHNRHNAFSINHLLIGLTYADSSVRGAIGLHTGTYPLDNYAHEPQLLRHINEANVEMRLVKNLWFGAGVFPSHIGFESAISANNLTLSRSLMAENSPYYETGARLSFEPQPGKFTLQVLVLNGWQVIAENNTQKALGMKAEWTPGKWTISYSNYVGRETVGPTNLRKPLRVFQNFYAGYSFRNNLRLALVTDFGVQEKTSSKTANWHSAAVFLNQKFGKHWAITARGEYYKDKKGIIISPENGNQFQVSGGSLTVGYAPAEKALLRVEARYLKHNAGVRPTPVPLFILMSSLSLQLAY